ncbi:dihydrofolate reductase [Ichthyobacterium seriolicida]|uniref:Dihydrofolate reductase n=1 Tax=Ichthyobacterium seriolicida TaxID=242600 RepID=A0A1J1DYQ0_9FLAO|nr:dihydrofolate reductase [Ichthyobacterium seriolicida]BAV95050.1 dihydrofolate reductase [Ichthyobacterium seriolicida]
MALTIIAAVSKNNVIGNDNHLIWHLPEDLKRFKKLTMGNSVIMGRKTFDSLNNTPLKGRRNIVVTRNVSLEKHSDCDIVHSLQEAIELVKDEETTFILGGGEIYRQALPMCKKIELTRVDENFQGDVFFPELSPEEWKEIKREDHRADKENKYPYSFITLIRK